jgi:hypothetical protein
MIEVPYVENKVEHKMNLARIGHKEKNIYFQQKDNNKSCSIHLSLQFGRLLHGPQPQDDDVIDDDVVRRH